LNRVIFFAGAAKTIKIMGTSRSDRESVQNCYEANWASGAVDPIIRKIRSIRITHAVQLTFLFNGGKYHGNSNQ
jgi:hypothetical protein